MNTEGLIKRNRARALAFRECGDMLDNYESADEEHDTPVHIQARGYVMDLMYDKAYQCEKRADTLERQAVIDRNRGAGVTFV